MKKNVKLMGKQGKNNALILYQVLMKYSDKEHPLSMSDIKDYMAEETAECGRDSIVRYLNQLEEEMGIDIHRGKGQAAIKKNKQIIFDYMKWNNHKQLVRKNIEGKYSINPWTLIWANDRYYLYGYDTFEKNGVRKERHYRVDKLDNIEIMETDRQGKELFMHFNADTYVAKRMGMYTDKERLYDKSKSIIKTFTYSVYLPGAVFDKDVIKLKETRFKIFFTDADMGQTIEWFNSFQLMRMKKYPLNNNAMKLISIKSQNRKEIVDNELVIKMQSPLIVRQHNADTNKDEYYTYDSAEFADKVRDNVSIFLQKVNLDISMEDFSLLPVKGKKVVVNCFGRKIDANIGIYKITGNQELLNILYQSGLGSRRSVGHGKWEVLM